MKEAAIYMHEWFTSATESPCVATARLCHGDCINEKTGFSGKVWFICGELCSGGELFCYLPCKKVGSPPVVPFEERFARRIFGQLAHGAYRMKHCAEHQTTSPAGVPVVDKEAEQRRRRFNHGCFHRDLKLENIVISDDFDAKISQSSTTPIHFSLSPALGFYSWGTSHSRFACALLPRDLWRCLSIQCDSVPTLFSAVDYGDLYFTKDEVREARESEEAGSMPLRSIHHFEWVKRGKPKGKT